MSPAPVSTVADLLRAVDTEGMPSTEIWRHVVLQALDIYESRQRAGSAAPDLLTSAAAPPGGS